MHTILGSCKSLHTKRVKGSRRQEGWEREAQNTGEQTGDLWKGEGWGEVHRANKMALQGLSGRKAGNLKEVGLEWINGGRKDQGFGWGKIRDGGERLF